MPLTQFSPRELREIDDAARSLGISRYALIKQATLEFVKELQHDRKIPCIVRAS